MAGLLAGDGLITVNKSLEAGCWPSPAPVLPVACCCPVLQGAHPNSEAAHPHPLVGMCLWVTLA